MVLPAGSDGVTSPRFAGPNVFEGPEVVARSAAVAASSDDITGLPPLLHFVWVGSPPTPKLRSRLSTWSSINPQTLVLLWDEEAVRELAKDDADVVALLDAVPNAAAFSDIARFLILVRHGGIYLDCDMEACRPITALLDDANGFVVRESRWSITASAIGLVAGSMYGQAALAVMKSELDRFGEIDNYVTGPPLVTELHRVLRLLRVPDRPAVLPAWTFFPDNPFRFPRRDLSGMPAYGIHLYDHTWASGGELTVFRRLARVAQVMTPKDVAVGRKSRTQRALKEACASEVAQRLNKTNEA